jgi:hypothetical protein
MSERSSIDPLVSALHAPNGHRGLTSGWKAMIAGALLLAAAAVVLSVVLFAAKARQDADIQAGRTVVIDVLCNVDKATIKAGQSVIQGTSLTPAQDRWFAARVPDWPTLAERRAAGREAARKYAESVAAAVAGSLSRFGVRVPRKVPPQGVDCRVLLKAARADPAPPRRP